MNEAHHPDAEEMLRAAGLRVTRQRVAIMRVLLTSTDHPDAETVLARARQADPSVSQATTYRTLAALAEKGILRNHSFGGASFGGTGAARFEAGNRPHHDHLIDIDTGRVIEFLSPEIEALQRQIAARYGYDLVDHRLELYCRRKRD